MSHITYETAKQNDYEIISDYFNNNLGQWTNYGAIDSTQRTQLLAQKHTDLRSFYPAAYKSSYLIDLYSTNLGSLNGTQVQNINAPVLATAAEPWVKTSGNGTLAITTASGWRQLEFTFADANEVVITSTSDPIDISSYTNANDKISIALPSLPSLTFGSCYVKLSDGTTEVQISFTSAGVSSSGNKELIFPVSSLGNTIKKELIKTIEFVLVGGTNGDKFICRGIRCLSANWKYAPVDINTLENKLVKTLPRNGVSGSYEFATNNIGSNLPTDWPVLYRTFDETGDIVTDDVSYTANAKDPKLLNASIYGIIETGPSTGNNSTGTAFNKLTFYFRNQDRPVSQIELNQTTQAMLNSINDVQSLASGKIPRTQGEYSKIVGAVTGTWGGGKPYQSNPELLPTQSGSLQSDLTVVSDTTKNIGNRITAASGDGTNVTYTTALNHGLSNGNSVTIAGFTPTGYNITGTATVVNSRSFSVANATTTSVTTYGYQTGNFYQIGASTNQAGLTQTYLEQKAGGTLSYLAASLDWYKPIYNITSATWATNKITITTEQEHNFDVGYSVTLAGVGTNYNGSYVVTDVIEPNQFKVAKASDPGAANLNSATVTLNDLLRFEIHVDDELSTIFTFMIEQELTYWQNNKTFVFKAEVNNQSLECKLFELTNNKLITLLKTNKIESNFFHDKKGRFGWFANILDYQTKISSIRAGKTIYGEYRSKPMNSITPVKGAQIFANQTADKELINDIKSNPWSIGTNAFYSTIDRSDPKKPISIYEIKTSVDKVYQGIETNEFKIQDFEDIYINFDIQFNSSNNKLLAFLHNKTNNHYYEINMPFINKNQWNSVKLFLHNDDLIPGNYSLVLAEDGKNNNASWYVKNMSIKHRAVNWESRSFIDGPWEMNDRDWIKNYYINLIPNNDFTKGTNRRDGAMFTKQDTELQIRAQALSQYVEIFNFEVQPKYATPGNFVWEE